MPKLEKYYLHCFAVWFGEKHVATLSTDCRQAGQAGSIKLTFENEVFYTSPGWYYYLRELEQHLPLSFKSISCLDIAADFQSDSLLPELCRIYRYSSFIDENTEIEYAPLVGKLGCTLRHGKQYEFGTSVTKRGSNGKQVAVYNKTLEIEEISHKQYILDYYAAQGFDTTKPVVRVEVRLTAAYLSKLPIDDVTLNRLDGLASIFRQAVGNTFAFRKVKETYFDASRNKKTATFTLIDFAELDAEPLAKTLPVIAYKENNDVCNRIEAKNAMMRWIHNGDAQDLAQLLYIEKNVPAPKSSTWRTCFTRFASAYDRNVTEDRASRMGMFQ